MNLKWVSTISILASVILAVSCGKNTDTNRNVTPQRQDVTAPEPKQITNELQITLIKTEQRYTDAALLSFRVYNNSDVFLSVCDIDVEIYNQNGEYLGKVLWLHDNVRPRQSYVEEGHFDGKVNEVATWKPQLAVLKDRDDYKVTADFLITGK